MGLGFEGFRLGTLNPKPQTFFRISASSIMDFELRSFRFSIPRFRVLDVGFISLAVKAIT